MMYKKIHKLYTPFALRCGFTQVHARHIFDISMDTIIVLGLSALIFAWWSPFMAWFWLGALIGIGHMLILIKNIYALSTKKWAPSLALGLFFGLGLRLFITVSLAYGLIFFYDADTIALLCGLSTALGCLMISIVWPT